MRDIPGIDDIEDDDEDTLSLGKLFIGIDCMSISCCMAS